MLSFVMKSRLFSAFCSVLFAAVILSSPCSAGDNDIIMDAGAAGLVQLSQLDTALRNSLRDAAESFLYNRPEDGESSAGLYEDPGKKFTAGLGVGYSRHDIDANGDAEVDGVSGLLTMSRHEPGTPFFYGVFGEFFDGEYDTSGITNDGGEAAAFGELSSYGGGVFAQYRPYLAVENAALPAVWIPGLYIDASARVGHSDMEFKSPKPTPYKFDVDGRYYGASVGGGYIFEVSSDKAVDVYSRLAWTAAGDRGAITCKSDSIYFDRGHSLRLVTGFRAGFAVSERTHTYAGMALEWEFMDGPDTYFRCVKVGDSDVSGLSGLFEAGVNWQAADDVFVDLNVFGSGGQRDSFGGTLEVKYRF